MGKKNEQLLLAAGYTDIPAVTEYFLEQCRKNEELFRQHLQACPLQSLKSKIHAKHGLTEVLQLTYLHCRKSLSTITSQARTYDFPTQFGLFTLMSMIWQVESIYYEVAQVCPELSRFQM